jgi:hypothetical protein
MNIDEQKLEEDLLGDVLHLCSKTVDDEYLPGETVLCYSNRRHAAHMMKHYKAEVQQADSILAPLLFRMKQRLSRPGRNGRWHAWLKQNKIERSCADRLVLDFAESIGRRYELPSRYIPEPLQGNISLAAHRASERVEKKLTTTRSRMQFLSCLANLLDLSVDWDGDSVRLGPPAPCELSEAELCKVPNVIEVLEDGTIRPVDYELRDYDGADFPL